MNKILLITVICFSANTQGFRKCLELQTWKIPNGTSNTTELCIPAEKPADCSEVAWANLISPFTKRSGIRSCQGGINPIGILQMRARPTFSPLKETVGSRILSGRAADISKLLFYNEIEACTADAPAPGGTAPAECQFPFTYDDRTYNECTYYKTANNKAWCRTVNGALGDCNPGCPGI